METHHKQIVLPCPEHIKPHRDVSCREKVCIDEGIMDVIKYLWENKIVTSAVVKGIPE